MKTTSCATGLALLAGTALAQPNVLVNPGAETGTLEGWVDALGHGFQAVQPGAFDPVEGAWVFTGGATGPSGPLQNEIRQDADVSNLAAEIDAGLVAAVFTGWGRTAASDDGTAHDDASLFVEYRSTSGAVLATYASGVITPFNTWVRVQDARIVPAGTRAIRVRLHCQRAGGLSTDGYFDDLSLVVAPAGTSVADVPPSPALTCFPNPSNPRTTLRFTMPAAGRVVLTIHDVRGRVVARLVAAELSGGPHQVTWDGQDDEGRALPSGSYLCRLATTAGARTTRLQLVR